MTTGSLGLRSSGSYGSLQQQQFQNGSLPNQTTPPVTSRKPSKMLKEKERLFPWICKFAPRKKVGMLLLCAVSAAVFVWVLYVGKGDDVPEPSIQNVQFNSSIDYSGFSPKSLVNETIRTSVSTENGVEVGAVFAPPPPPPPPPLIYFTGYTLPPGNPCEGFRMPPPPSDPKRNGPRPCPVCYLDIDQVISLIPNASSFSPVVKNLTHVHQENLTKTEFGGSEFGGYPSLSQRNDSYDVRETMCVYCGFVKGIKPGRSTGFEIDEDDLLEMERCQGLVVASAIFGAFDLISQPKNVSEYTKKNACFYMFLDEETESYFKNISALDNNKKSGLWRIVVVRKLPYTDPRRNGKVPKLLLHRLFPNTRYSVWIDGKLELVVDPYKLLERFLWRQNATFAISRHYKRFDVFEEAMANKNSGKFENASIDFQIEFYKKEGLSPYSEAKLPITSDVPEGCVIIREHTPLTNLFSCLWFNEVDRFTPRDQLSFSTVRDKIMAKTNWTVNMFLDCERRNFVNQKYHRELLERIAPPPPPTLIMPPTLPTMDASAENNVHETPTKKIPSRRPKDRKSRRHRKIPVVVKGVDTL